LSLLNFMFLLKLKKNPGERTSEDSKRRKQGLCVYHLTTCFRLLPCLVISHHVGHGPSGHTGEASIRAHVNLSGSYQEPNFKKPQQTMWSSTHCPHLQAFQPMLEAWDLTSRMTMNTGNMVLQFLLEKTLPNLSAQ
jgi:hypothetical protein